MTKPDKRKRKNKEIRYATKKKGTKMENILKKMAAATTAVEAVEIYQAEAWELDTSRPPMAGCCHAEALPKRKDGEDWVWARVQTNGTGNGGRWVATRPISGRARVLRGALMDTLSRLLPGFDVAYLATCSLFWERPVLSWFDELSPEMAKMLGDQPSVKSRRQAATLEWKGFPLPATSIPRTAAAISMAAAAAAAGR